jgi:hypothetical protein
MSSSLTVRPARVEDVAQMARVNVRCWQETYRGLMSDAVLDDPGFLAARERFWTVALTDERYRENRVAVAERDGELVGMAISGPPLDATATWARQLYVLYVYAADHGALREAAETLPARDDSPCEQHAEAQQSVVAGVGFDRLISRSRQRVGAAAGRSARFTLL